MKYIGILLGILFLFALFFPRRVPRLLRRTGRVAGDVGRAGQEFVTGVEVRGSPLARYEVRAGKIVALRILTLNALSPDVTLQARVRDIGGRLAAHAQRHEIPYQFSVLESGEPNAFAVPGGSIFITRRLLDLCDDRGDCVAGVLGHEVIHVDRFHAIRTLAATTAVRTGFHVLSLGRAAILSRIAGGMEDLLVKGYRQDQELEADIFGVRIARLAGFDPLGFVELLRRLREVQPEAGGRLEAILGYFRTHPSLDVRIENLRKEIARLGTRP